MTSSHPGQFLVFDSSSYPARAANDPDANDEAKGRACFELILDLVSGANIAPRGMPTAHGSGFSTYVDAGETSVVIHLTWWPVGPPRGPTRDLWTLQFGRSRDGLLDLFRSNEFFERDKAALSVAAEVFRALQARSDEFIDPRWFSWHDLTR